MKIAVIILNWNQTEATMRCIGNLLTWKRLKPQLWIVDNASRGANCTPPFPAHPALTCLFNKQNLGFAGGNNTALRQILPTGADTVLLLNNDAAIGEDQAAELMRALADNPGFGIVGPLLEEQHGRRKLISAGGRDMARHVCTRRLFPDKATPQQKAAPVEVDYVPGTAALIRADVFRTAGLLEEAYFFSGEMADFCRRARAAKWRCAVIPGVCIRHDTSAGPLRATLYRYYTLRNRFLFVRRNELQRQKFFLFIWTFCGILTVLYAYLRGRPKEARAARQAVQDGLSGKFGNRNALFGL